MSDARRRRLEREVARGETTARAALLGERARAGDLTRERLVLAAHLGDADAAHAAGVSAVPTGDSWFSVLGAFSDEVALRAVLAVARLAQPFRRTLERPGARADAALAPGHAWAAALCAPAHAPDTRERARGLARQQQAFADRFGPGSGLRWYVGWSPSCACACVGLSALDAPLVLARLADPHAQPWLADAPGLTPARVRAAIVDDLLPWALGQDRAA